MHSWFSSLDFASICILASDCMHACLHLSLSHTPCARGPRQLGIHAGVKSACCSCAKQSMPSRSSCCCFCCCLVTSCDHMPCPPHAHFCAVASCPARTVALVGTCVDCPVNCSTCVSGTNCTACVSGSFLNKGSCGEQGS